MRGEKNCGTNREGGPINIGLQQAIGVKNGRLCCPTSCWVGFEGKRKGEKPRGGVRCSMTLSTPKDVGGKETRCAGADKNRCKGERSEEKISLTVSG